MRDPIHRLWDELGLEEEWPQLRPKAVRRRVDAALDGSHPAPLTLRLVLAVLCLAAVGAGA